MRLRVVLVFVTLVGIAASGFAGLQVARLQMARRNGPLILVGTVQAATVDVVAEVNGRVRLVAVREGDTVKAGQLVAWLEAPELRTAADEADQELRDVQKQLAELGKGRSRGTVDEGTSARARARAAQRELDEARELADQAPALAQRVEAAHIAREEARTALREAEARVAEARARSSSSSGTEGSTTGGSSDSGLESGSDGGTGTGTDNPGAADSPASAPAVKPVEDPDLAAALDAEGEARARLRDAEREVSAAERKRRDADAAPGRIASLTAEAERATAEAERAKSEAESTPHLDQQNATEDLLRREVRQAQAAASAAHARLKDTLIVAPASGRVESVGIQRGGGLAVGQKIATIRSLAAIWAEVQVPWDRAARLRRGQAVTAMLEGASGAVLQGIIDDVAQPREGSFTDQSVRVALTDPDHRLQPGAKVQITFR